MAVHATSRMLARAFHVLCMGMALLLLAELGAWPFIPLLIKWPGTMGVLLPLFEGRRPGNRLLAAWLYPSGPLQLERVKRCRWRRGIANAHAIATGWLANVIWPVALFVSPLLLIGWLYSAEASVDALLVVLLSSLRTEPD